MPHILVVLILRSLYFESDFVEVFRSDGTDKFATPFGTISAEACSLTVPYSYVSAYPMPENCDRIDRIADHRMSRSATINP